MTQAELEGRLQALESSLKRVKEDHAFDAAAFYDFVWKSFADVDLREARIQRYIPIRIYIDDNREDWQLNFQKSELLRALFRFLATAEFGYLFELPEQRGSVRQHFGAITKFFGSEDDTKRRLRELEQAARVAMLEKPLAETEKLKAEAAKAQAEAEKIKAETEKIQADKAAVLLDKAKDFDNVAINFGDNLIVVRSSPDGTKTLFVGALSSPALRALEQNVVEQIKPEHAPKLLGPNASTIEADRLPPPPPEDDEPLWG